MFPTLCFEKRRLGLIVGTTHNLCFKQKTKTKTQFSSKNQFDSREMHNKLHRYVDVM